MGKRTRDEVIYSRVDYRVKQEFESQMKESGYKTSADFIDYLLRGNKGRQIDGTTLKQFMEVMNEVCYELKKAGSQYQPAGKEYQCLSGFDIHDSI
mgnify:CR=1 FL=1